MNNRKTRKTALAIALMFGVLASCAQKQTPGYSIEDVDNANGSAIYEIFVGSFADSNGDGVGDLKGIEAKLPYLDSLGVKYLWLTPVHPSPTYHKYDVKDYYAIDPSFGTLDDFDSLVAKARERGIGILMDMVFNHTSIRSSWFDSFATAFYNNDRESPYFYDFSWSKTPKDGYHFSDRVGVYVESHFSESMPELNFDSEHVRTTLAAIQKFWLDKGVAGFRYDAVKYYYCDENNGTVSGNVEKNVEAMSFLAQEAKKVKSDVYLVGEDWDPTTDIISSYAASGMNCFSFPTSGLDGRGSVGDMLTLGGEQRFVETLVETQAAYREKRADADVVYFVSNHDQDRWGSFAPTPARVAKKESDARKVMASAYLLTPGTPAMYYGEELEMLGSRGASELTDAARRQPMVWGEDKYTCGYPEGKKVANQVTVGVKQAQKDGYSVVNHYRKVLSIRNKYNDLFRYGTYSAFDVGEARAVGLQIERNGQRYVLIHNCNVSSETITMPTGLVLLEEINTAKVAPTLSEGVLTLGGYSSVLLKQEVNS